MHYLLKHPNIYYVICNELCEGLNYVKFDYHMHFEYGSYDLDWVRGFFDSAKTRGIDEIGISEHSHGFIEFKELYYDELILDDSIVGQYQQKWLKKKVINIMIGMLKMVMVILRWIKVK